MFLRHFHFVPTFLCSIGPDGGTADGGGPSGGGSSSSASPAPAPAAAPSSGSTSSASPSAPGVASTSSPQEAPVLGDTGGEAFDFSAIFSGPNEAPVVTPPVPVAAAPVAAPTVPPVPPGGVEPPKPAVAAPAVPATEVAAPAVPTQPTSATPQAPTLDPSDPGSVAAHLVQHQDAAIQHIADNMFKLSPEDVEALEADVVGTVPKLLARTFVQTQRVLLTQMARMIPAMIERQTVAKARNSEAEGEFYARWPQIDSKAHGDIVKRYAVVYRQMHPNDTKEQMFEALGPLVIMAAKLPMVAPTVSGAPAKPQRQMPFVPATGGAAAPISSQELSAVEAMFQDS